MSESKHDGKNGVGFAVDLFCLSKKLIICPVRYSQPIKPPIIIDIRNIMGVNIIKNIHRSLMHDRICNAFHQRD